MSFDNVNLDGHGLQFRSDLRVDSKEQDATMRFTLAPRTPAYTDSFIATLGHTDIENLTTRDVNAGWAARLGSSQSDQLLPLLLSLAAVSAAGRDRASRTRFTAKSGHVWRRVDDLLSPTKGFAFGAQLGGGPPGVSTRAFGRGIARFEGWIPVDLKTQIAVRAEAGAVFASTSDGIPQPLLFRTGGDTTVRGYSFLSLGPHVGDAVVGGRYYAVASVEVVRWIEQSWGIAVFTDAGNAAENLSDLKPAYGYGVGARIRTPIGPFRFDVAYGQQDKSVHVHLSVGVSF